MTITAPSPSSSSSSSSSSTPNKSKSLTFIRHAESSNNALQVEAHKLFPDQFSSEAISYVLDKRSADPNLSLKGSEQADLLGSHLLSKLSEKSSITLVVSPVKRTCLTIAPTIGHLSKLPNIQVNIIIHREYFEFGGIYDHTKSYEQNHRGGLSLVQMEEVLFKTCYNSKKPHNVTLSFEAMPREFVASTDDSGWYKQNSGVIKETHEESIRRIYRFRLFLDSLVAEPKECEIVFVGHGEFMSYLLTTLVSPSNGTHLETRLARGGFVLRNTSLTSVHIFPIVKRGPRCLLLSSNRVEHLHGREELESGGNPDVDGWMGMMCDDGEAEESVDTRPIQKFTSLSSIPSSVWSEVVALREAYLFTVDNSTLEEYEHSDKLVHHFISINDWGNVEGYAQLDTTLSRIRQVIVKPGIQKKGVGSKLMRAIRSSPTIACDSGFLIVNCWVVKSSGFYKRIGFEQLSAVYVSKGIECVQLRMNNPSV